MCLPPDKSSPEAQDILKLFKNGNKRNEQKVSDCSGFSQNNMKEFEFKCPIGYHGCMLRIHGKKSIYLERNEMSNNFD